MTKISGAVFVTVIGAIAAIVVTGSESKGSGGFSVAAAAQRSQFPQALESIYVPSGWMGDGEGKKGPDHLSTRREAVDVDGEEKVGRRVEYKKAGPKGWAGLRWQHPESNWGEKPGADLRGAREISFKARGARGGEIVDFVVGGIKNDSLSEIKVQAILDKKKWKSYTIEFEGRDLKNVAGGFGLSAAASDNELPLVVYIADLQIR